jgi:hypothetical protein
MATIYRKTAQGQDEIETRARRLAPRLRSALILVDGKRSEDELRKVILQQPDEALQALLEQGLIEVAAVTQARPRPEPATAPTPLGTPAVSAPAPLAPEFATLRREAVHALNETLGPMGETLALKMEKAASLAELRPLLETAVTVIGNARGGGAAARFAMRFLED